MNIHDEIKKEGIEVIKELDSATVNSIASKVSKSLQVVFPEKNLDPKKISSSLLELKMYLAKLPEGCSAKYFYKNQSIYFSEKTSFTKLSDLIIHECIHFLQERTDKKGRIYRLGFCDFTDSYFPGTGLNEAAVQLLASTCVKKKMENATYFGITLNTPSPNFYPLETAIANQLNTIVGDNLLFESTLNSTDDFKNKFISLTSKKTYERVFDNLDLLIDKQDHINELSTYNANNYNKEKKVQKNYRKIENIKSEIRLLFFETQDLIVKSYFDNAINLVYSKETMENYRTKLYEFRNIIASADGYSFYSKYYINQMMELEKKQENNFGLNTSLVVYKKGVFGTFFSKLKSVFGLSSKEKSTSNENFYD